MLANFAIGPSSVLSCLPMISDARDVCIPPFRGWDGCVLSKAGVAQIDLRGGMPTIHIDKNLSAASEINQQVPLSVESTLSGPWCSQQ